MKPKTEARECLVQKYKQTDKKKIKPKTHIVKGKHNRSSVQLN